MSGSNVYVEPGYKSIPKVRLEDAEYARAMQRFAIVCTDALICDRLQGLIFLAKRRSKPMTGWWVIGGGTMAGETALESVHRCFKRETKLDVYVNRFNYFRPAGDADNEYFWKDRQQAPQDVGCHALARTFWIELTEEERSSVATNLDRNEYDESAGLCGFDRKALMGGGVHPAIIDMYKALFSK